MRCLIATWKTGLSIVQSPTDEDTETDKEDLIRDYIIEDDNNTCETGCE